MTFVMFFFFGLHYFRKVFRSSMSVIYILIGASLFVALVFLVLFFKSAQNGQFDDTYTPSVRMLFDDPPVEKNDENQTQEPTSKTK